jgi:two-component SAPR family response regulator
MHGIINKRFTEIVLLLISLIHLSFVWPDSMEDKVEEGLYFHSFKVDKDSRTGLHLTPEKALSLPNGFTLAFDFKIRRERDIYGYIFRIVGDQETNIDLISTIEANSLMLVMKNTTLMEFHFVTEIPEVSEEKWVSAELTVDTDRNLMTFTVNGLSKSAGCEIGHLEKFDICFGWNDNSNFATTDVTPFILKDVKLYDNKKRPIRHWRLNKHGDGYVVDEYKSAKAIATNAVWKIDRHTEWRKHATITTSGQYPQIAFDKDHKRVFIVNNNIIFMYDAEKDITNRVKPKRGIPFKLEINQLLYESATGQLIMYDFEKNHLGRFDFTAEEWNNDDDTLVLSHFMHHNKYFDEKSRTLYALGGYGFHQYSALLQSFPETTSQWERADLSAVIHPRYLASMGTYNDSLLLFFGGYGNESGKQYESPHNYYDLYTIHPKTQNINKIWELTDVDKHFTNSNSLVVNKANQTFYTLSYPNNIFETQAFLHEYSLQTPGFRKLGNPIPFLFNDVESYCDLFIPADSSALFAVTSSKEGNDSKVEIYSISYPPLSRADTLQTDNKNASLLYILLYAMLSVIIALPIFLLGKRIRKMTRIKSVLKTIEMNNNADKKAEAEESKTSFPSIRLLDVFEVHDSKGFDISHFFAPMISQMFLLLYFRTSGEGKGITSNELQKILWPDKDSESARNNRNVYFNKLRPILNMIGVSLCKVKDFWILSYDKDAVFCDYEQVMKNIALIRENAELDKKLLRTTLRIVEKGKLLPSYELEWLDNYKTTYVNTVIEFSESLSTHPDVKNDLPLLLNIAEIILIQDSLEETAVKLKCGLLFKLGKKKQALQFYNKYAEEHLEILNIKPELTFDEIVKEL